MPSLKLFPASLTSAHWLSQFKDALDMPEADLAAANAVLRGESRTFLATLDYREVARRGAKETGLSEEDLRRILTVIFNLGFYVDTDSAFETALEDLVEAGLDESHRRGFSVLMNGLRFPAGRLAINVFSAVTSVVPNVIDARALCDLRAVFEDIASADAGDDKVTNLQALAPVVLLSLDIQDESGQYKSIVVQFSESGFSAFQRVVSNASLQLSKVLEIRQS